jgi:putative Ca2+/H+ antiporter (TMEM165/GDT1 family)
MLWLGTVLFLGFGVRLLLEAQRMRPDAAAEEAAEAEETVNLAETRVLVNTPEQVMREAFVLVFLAELGDRTQFATIFLATAPAFTFAGLLAGTLLGHALVTWLAVGAGRWIGGRLSERLLYRLSGGLFLVFGLFSLRQALG